MAAARSSPRGRNQPPPPSKQHTHPPAPRPPLPEPRAILGGTPTAPPAPTPYAAAAKPGARGAGGEAGSGVPAPSQRSRRTEPRATQPAQAAQLQPPIPALAHLAYPGGRPYAVGAAGGCRRRQGAAARLRQEARQQGRTMCGGARAVRAGWWCGAHGSLRGADRTICAGSPPHALRRIFARQ